jgi:hypothetical protein
VVGPGAAHGWKASRAQGAARSEPRGRGQGALRGTKAQSSLSDDAPDVRNGPAQPLAAAAPSPAPASRSCSSCLSSTRATPSLSYSRPWALWHRSAGARSGAAHRD